MVVRRPPPRVYYEPAPGPSIGIGIGIGGGGYRWRRYGGGGGTLAAAAWRRAVATAARLLTERYSDPPLVAPYRAAAADEPVALDQLNAARSAARFIAASPDKVATYRIPLP